MLRFMRIFFLLLVMLAVLPLKVQAANTPLQVTVSILPQKYFVERIGGDRVTVNVMVLPGASPATYEPTAQQLTALSQSAAYFSIGVPFEQAWLARIADANPTMLMVDTTHGIRRIGIKDHGKQLPDNYLPPENADPHIWLSPTLVAIQANTIYQFLAALDPANRAAYRDNLGKFLADISSLQKDIRTTLKGVKNPSFIVFHPAWGYFADEFGLAMIPIEVGGQEPSARELSDLVQKAKELKVSVIFAQPEFSTTAAKTIASQIGGQVMLISPLNPDWLANMRSVAETFAKVLGTQS